MKKLIALTLCTSMLGACATAGPRFQRFDAGLGSAAPQAIDKGLLAEYAQKLPPGTKVRVDRVNGDTVTGTLMKATADIIVVQRRTRIPEPPEQIPLDQIAGITPQAANGNIAKAIGIGAAAGAAAALGVILILIAAYD